MQLPIYLEPVLRQRPSTQDPAEIEGKPVEAIEGVVPACCVWGETPWGQRYCIVGGCD